MASTRLIPDGMAERQALQADLDFHLAQVSAIAAALAGIDDTSLPTALRETFVPLKTAAAAWGVCEDAARKRIKRLRVEAPALVTKRGGGRWWVHREALL